MTKRNLYKTFSAATFIVALLLLCVLTFVSFMAAFAKDEGTLGHNIFLNLLADAFGVLRFPVHNLFWQYMEGGMFIIGLLINCIFYALIIERIVYFLRQVKRR